MKREYAEGDECWIKVCGSNTLQRGTVQGYFQLDTQMPKFYIIQLDDVSHPFIENRDWTLMSPTASGPLPYEGVNLKNAGPAQPRKGTND